MKLIHRASDLETDDMKSMTCWYIDETGLSVFCGDEGLRARDVCATVGGYAEQ